MIKKCDWCGKQFQSSSRKKYCCEECLRLGKNEYARLRSEHKKIKDSYLQSYYTTNKLCKRYDCLYHAPYGSQNACDFCYLTGRLRNCGRGDNCTRYITSTPEEKQQFRTLMMQLSNEEYEQ